MPGAEFDAGLTVLRELLVCAFVVHVCADLSSDHGLADWWCQALWHGTANVVRRLRENCAHRHVLAAVDQELARLRAELDAMLMVAVDNSLGLDTDVDYVYV